MAQANNANAGSTLETTKHNLELRDVRDGELVVTYNHVKEGRTYVDAYHGSARLPMECLTLFDGGVIDAEELTTEERQWLTYEDGSIVFEEVAL